MDAGRIVEEGTHDSLLAQGNIYAMLVRRQTGNAADTARPRGDDKPSAALKAEVTTHVTAYCFLPLDHCDRQQRQNNTGKGKCYSM